MKTRISLIVIFLTIGNIYSQSSYFPLIEEDKTWHVLEGGFGGFITYTYKVEGDTLINQLSYSILYRSMEEFPLNWTKQGFIHEDENKKVYYIPYYPNESVLDDPEMVYDFMVNVGDTLSITSFAYNYPNELEIVISEIDSVLIGTNYRRRIKYQCEQFIENFWIEGIGSNNGLIEPGFYCYIVCPTIELLCVKEGNDVIYYNGYYDECYIVGKKEIKTTPQAFLIFPNPSKDFIRIIPHSDKISNLSFTLYDLEGSTILTEEINDMNDFNIDVRNLNRAVYLYRIINNSVLVQSGRIIIQ